MAEMYDNTTTTTNTNTCSTSLPSRPTIESDDISLFLHHLLHSSSSSPSPFISERAKQMPFSPPLFSSGSQFKTLSQDHNRPSQSTLIPDSNHRFSDPTSTSNSSAYIISSSELKESGDCDAVTVSGKRRKLPSENNDLDDFDCESEEGFELSEGSSKAVPPRNSSKRSRAAEVHNLSEKRRRSRINEKMRALQNLIPNSNKTDKASMLDEAIEYLKQLQLQVQMLSMRNGLSLHSTHLPGVMHPLQLPEVRMGFGEGNGFLPHINMGTDTLPVNQESSTRTSFGLSNQCTASHQAMVIPSVKNITNSETSYGLDLPIQEIYREEILPQRQLHINHSSRNLSESLPYDALASFLDTTSHVERSGLHRERSQDMLTKDVDNNQILIQHLHTLQTGGSVTNDSKIKALDF